MCFSDNNDDEREENPDVRQGLGTGTQGFFSDVVTGKTGVPETNLFVPEISATEINIANGWFESVGLGAFDEHIMCSIPSYFEMIRSVCYAVAHMNVATRSDKLLDLGASEGTFCAATVYGRPRDLWAYALEPNPEMRQMIHRHMGKLKIIPMALSPSGDFVSLGESNPRVEVYKFDDRFEYVTEFMTFQFLSPEREYYLQKISKSLGGEGLFISCEKFVSENEDFFVENEVRKDHFKLRHFSRQEIEQKNEAILEGSAIAADEEIEGMHSKMVDFADYERLLTSMFSKVVLFWSAGNFRGYACSNSEKSITDFIELLPNLTTIFSTEETPVEIVG